MRRHPPEATDRNLLAAGFALAGAHAHLDDPEAFADVQVAIVTAVAAFERWLAADDHAMPVAPATVLALRRLRTVRPDWRDLVIDSLRALQDAARAAAATADITAAEALGVGPVRLMRARVSGVESALCEILRAIEAGTPQELP